MKTLLPLLCSALMLSTPLAAQTLVANGSHLWAGTASVLRMPGDSQILAFELPGPGRAPPLGTHSSISVLRSLDDGVSWQTGTRPALSSNWERNAKLLPDGNGGCLLFYTAQRCVGVSLSLTEYRRETSADCIAFGNQSTLESFGNRAHSDFQIVRDTAGVLTIASCDTVVGAFVTCSTDGGVTWEAERTPTGSCATSLLYRPSDQRYFIAYWENGKLWVKSSGSGGARDWNTTPVEAYSSDQSNSPGSLVLLEDDSFLLVWRRYLDGQWDIWALRSTDGINWGLPFVLVQSPADDDFFPFALAGPAPATFDLFWTSRPISGATGYSLYRQRKQLPGDLIFRVAFEPL